MVLYYGCLRGQNSWQPHLVMVMAGLTSAIPIIGRCATPIEIAGTSPAMTRARALREEAQPYLGSVKYGSAPSGSGTLKTLRTMETPV
jgi:hypothetical protein